jgi:hypothetical protein
MIYIDWHMSKVLAFNIKALCTTFLNTHENTKTTYSAPIRFCCMLICQQILSSLMAMTTATAAFWNVTTYNPIQPVLPQPHCYLPH